MNYNINSKESIINYAKKLIGKTLRQSCNDTIPLDSFSGKGKFGQLLEKYYFDYNPNSNSEPDFKEAGLELKSSPIKKLKNGKIRSKERVVLNIINFEKVYSENFSSSSFWKKNAQLLFVFYLYEKDKKVIDYNINLVDKWVFTEEDLKIIESDWSFINKKINEGKAHELSEGSTLYLGACTKGGKGGNPRTQPFSKVKAKQRAYSLKQGYVNHIINVISSENDSSISNIDKNLHKLIPHPKILDVHNGLEQYVLSMFSPFLDKTPDQILDSLGIELNSNAKNYFSSITKSILKVDINKNIEEFSKADIEIKTIRLKENGMPKEDISFPSFKYSKIIKEDFEESDFYKRINKKFLFIFFQFQGDELYLKSVKFWNMPNQDILECKKVWDKTVQNIKNGDIVKSITNKGIRKTFFPNKKYNSVSHVRPHAKNKYDCFELPFPDKLTKVKKYTKHCFWLNASYIKDEVYLKS